MFSAISVFLGTTKTHFWTFKSKSSLLLCLRADGRSLAGHSDTLPDLHNEGVPPARQQTGAHRVIKCMLKGCIVFVHPFSQTQLALEADDVVFMACRKEQMNLRKHCQGLSIFLEKERISGRKAYSRNKYWLLQPCLLFITIRSS